MLDLRDKLNRKIFVIRKVFRRALGTQRFLDILYKYEKSVKSILHDDVSHFIWYDYGTVKDHNLYSN